MRSPVLARTPAAPTAATGAPSARVAPHAPTLELSRRGYWLLASVTLVGYLCMWLTHFQYVYGWLADDYSWSWARGQAMLQDWHNLFPATGYNNWQVYFLLVLSWPLSLGLSLPSYPLPLLGEQTGQFRFLLLCTVAMHAGVLGTWAVVAPELTASRLAALVSLVWLATSPTFTLWSPQPESRLLGLPFACLGIWVLLRLTSQPGARPGRRVGYLLAGSLFGVAASIHYTSLYLLLPVGVAYWGLRLWRGWRTPAAWRALAGFTVGVVWLPLLMEAVSYFVVGRPFEQGPLLGILSLRNLHTSPWTMSGNLSIWAEILLGQMGPLLLIGMALGWGVYLRAASRRGPKGLGRLALSLGLLLALLYLALANTMPFLRQTAFLQPFLFLGASLGVVTLVGRLLPSRRAGIAALAALVVALGVTQWTQSNSVFAAHQSVGRALEWAHQQPGERPLAWLPTAWFVATSQLASAGELEQAPADAWLMSYFPLRFVDDNPTLRPNLTAAPLLAAWPSLYATDTVRAEQRGYGFNDFRTDPLLHDVRIVALGGVQTARQQAPLGVRAVTADSQAGPAAEPVNVFDRDRSPDGETAWVAADSGGPHVLTAQLDQTVVLSGVDLVLPGKDAAGKDQFASRISSLAIELANAEGAYRPVWMGDQLAGEAMIAARWTPTPASAIRLTVHGQVLPTGAAAPATIEEVAIPGYTLVSPAPQRSFPDLALRDARPTEAGLIVGATNATPHTMLVINGQAAPQRLTSSGDLQAVGPNAAVPPSDLRELYLTDGFRRSNTLLGTPQLQALRPASTPAGVLFSVQSDGTSSTLVVDCAGVTPSMTVWWDEAPLIVLGPTACPLTALLRPEALAAPGRHQVTLRNHFGTSNALDFVVTAPVQSAPGGAGPAGSAASNAR